MSDEDLMVLVQEVEVDFFYSNSQVTIAFLWCIYILAALRVLFEILILETHMMAYYGDLNGEIEQQMARQKSRVYIYCPLTGQSATQGRLEESSWPVLKASFL